MYISKQFTFVFLKAKVQALVNTATIQRIHSTTKYHQAKVTTTKKNKEKQKQKNKKQKKSKKTKKKTKKKKTKKNIYIYMYTLFQKYPNWKSRANIHPIRPAT